MNPTDRARFLFVPPQIDPTAYVASQAVVIGDVRLAAHTSVWPTAVLRGDINYIEIGEGSNIQDGSIVHVNEGEAFATIIGDEVTIGHAAIIHACKLHDRAFVAMGATVLDGAVIEEGGVLAAGGLLPPGKRIGRFELWQGSPAKLVRVLDAEERARKFDSTAPHYVALGARFRAGLRPA